MLAYITHLIVLTAVVAISASALNLLIGYTGVFSAAQAVFYGIGGYTGALVALHIGTSIFLAMAIAVVVSGVLSILLALPAARVTGEYFVVASLAFEVIGSTIFAQWSSVTGGPAGLIGIPRATVFGVELSSEQSYLWLSLACLVFVLLVLYGIAYHTPLGRSLAALRDDATAAQALGRNPFRLRLIAVVISGALAAIGGVIYASYVGFINADSFSVNESVLLLAMVILGGAGRISGPVIGAAIVTLFPALLDYANLPDALKGPIEQAIYGGVLVILMIVKPAGVASAFADLGHWMERTFFPTARTTEEPNATSPGRDATGKAEQSEEFTP
jgi:branched-chain amino acid transport system permease protein